MKKLQQERRWCLWRYETRDDGDITKVPYMPNGRHARTDNRDTWSKFFIVLGESERDNSTYDGIGLFFDGRLCGIDVDAHDGPNPYTDDVLDLFKGTYIERSPSGTGYHILFYADGNRLPVEKGKNGKLKLKGYLMKPSKPSNGLEFYAGGLTNRYFTWTGNRVSDGDEVTDQTDALLVFLDRYMKDQRTSAQADAAEDQQTHTRLSDQPFDLQLIADRLDMARRAKNGDLFRALYDQGDTSRYNGDDSAADQALCGMLAFWLKKDPAAIDAAFRKSKLYRSKWDEMRGGQTYGELTIHTAVTTVTDTYSETRFKYKPTAQGDLTDAGNAEVFARLYGHNLRWCDAIGWLVWNGKRWADDEHAAMCMALEFSENMLDEACRAHVEDIKAQADEKASKAYVAHAKYTRKRAGITGFMELAKSRLAIPARDLDSNPYVLNTDAGLVDLHTGVCVPHDPAQYCTKLSPFSPSGTGAEAWTNFLRLVCADDDDLAHYLQVALGMSIIGHVGDEALRIAYGEGRNGKSTLFNAIKQVLGDYCDQTHAELFIADSRINKENYMAELRGKRVILCGELEEGQRLSVRDLKRLTSTDEVKVKRLYKNPETITPTYHMFMYTNHLPRVGSNDTGTWRRLLVLPFTATMPSGDAEIKDYARVLVSQAGGAILQWLIDGAVEYLTTGEHLPTPACVAAATDTYKSREDVFRHFLDECCVTDPAATCTKSDLYQAYKLYTAQNNAFTVKVADFEETMKRHGYRMTNAHNRAVFYGIRRADALTDQ